MITPFSIARLPRIEFGGGVFAKLPDLVATYGTRVLLVTGGRFFQNTEHHARLTRAFTQHGMQWLPCTIDGEPSPARIDAIVAEHRDNEIQVVLGIGGGSALDSAKAIAGLLRVPQSVMDFLEGVGPELTYAGPAVPFIAVPTTAGTGAEATKNAVLSTQGVDGFKKSFRHDALVAEYAVVDPDLLTSCTPELIAANGMDALTQLMESYVSTRANPFTDALAVSGLRAARDALVPWYEQGAAAPHAVREQMAYAALASGITLAQTGLGSVHGLASPLGAFFPIPHGIVCGTLVARATEVNIHALQTREPHNPALAKYARLADILCARRPASQDAGLKSLIELLYEWTRRLRLPTLNAYGVTTADLPRIAAHARGSSMKTNPVVLTDAELQAIVTPRLG